MSEMKIFLKTIRVKKKSFDLEGDHLKMTDRKCNEKKSAEAELLKDFLFKWIATSIKNTEQTVKEILLSTFLIQNKSLQQVMNAFLLKTGPLKWSLR